MFWGAVLEKEEEGEEEDEGEGGGLDDIGEVDKGFVLLVGLVW